MRRQLELKTPNLAGDDIKPVQQALGLTGRAVDGVYGGDTADRVQEWKWFAGYPKPKINSVLGLWGQALLFGEIPLPADFKKRADERKGQPWPPAKKGVIRPLTTDPGKFSEFALADAEGAPDNAGTNRHAGKDWFAPGGTPVRAPISGKVVEAKVRKKNTGQVFGGTVKIQGADGKVWVFRHVDPKGVTVGSVVDAGQVVATVTNWKGGRSHAHIEIWKTLSGGYDYENMVDPMKFF